MTVTATQFRLDYPEFTDTTKYTDSAINRQIGLAAYFLSSCRWDANIVDYGTELYVAHYLVLGARAILTAAAGGIPGTGAMGPQASKTVDKVSTSNDTKAVTLADAGHWNSTLYGIQFYQMAMMVGAGAVQL